MYQSLSCARLFPVTDVRVMQDSIVDATKMELHQTGSFHGVTEVMSRNAGQFDPPEDRRRHHGRRPQLQMDRTLLAKGPADFIECPKASRLTIESG